MGLRWSDIDLDAKTIRVSRTLSFDSGVNVIEAEPKTKNGRRVISLDDGTVAVLRQHYAHSDNDILLPNSQGNYRDPRYVTSTWVKLLKTRGLTRIKFHSLRHLHATLLLEQNVNPKVVSERLGHADVKITLGTYSHVSKQLDEGAALAIGNAMKVVDTQ